MTRAWKRPGAKSAAVVILRVVSVDESVDDRLARARRLFHEGKGPEAIELVKPIAARGRSDAQVLMGWAYEQGRGVGADAQVAEEWYDAAARQRDVHGMFYLGRLCDLRGDRDRAVALLERCAARDFAPALYRLAYLADTEDEKIRCLELAKRRGHIGAGVRLARLRLGRTRSPIEASRLLLELWRYAVEICRLSWRGEGFDRLLG